MARSTLKKWAADGKINIIQTPGGKRLYLTKDIIELFQGKEEIEKRKIGVIYGRVSSQKQTEDLERQVNYLKELYPDYEIIKDVASGLNFERKGLKKLLEMCSEGCVSTVVVTNKDRLARYGTELILWIFQKFNVEIIFQNSDSQIEAKEELSDDIISIITVFTARYYGNRSAENKRRRKIEKTKREEGEGATEETTGIIDEGETETRKEVIKEEKAN